MEIPKAMSVEKVIDDPDEPVTVKGMSPKEMKVKARQTFEENPEKYPGLYPAETLKKFGYSRTQCKCKNWYWRRTEDRDTCGDSACVGKYTFIGKGVGHCTYQEAYEGWHKAFSEPLNEKVKAATAINRFPVVARWRKDVDYVAAGIYCFQPYCVTGELEPPANPLTCGQFCLRFNDLDSVGISGRHYSGFVMLGLQVFNSPKHYVFFKEETTEYNIRWMQSLGLKLDDVTFIEDIWAGGGNLGPSLEYFIGGLELGNMVFMQFKTFPERTDASWLEPLSVQVIDVGAGLERTPWLINGTATSYVDVFKGVLEFLRERIGVECLDLDENWMKFGEYCCKLNVDETEDMEKEWQEIADTLKVEKMRVLRHVFTVLGENKAEDGKTWWEKLAPAAGTPMDGLMELFDIHRRELAPVLGKFKTYKSFRAIIEIEFERWKLTEKEARKKLDGLLSKKKRKGKGPALLDLDDWILCVTTFGLDPDTVGRLTGQAVPSDLNYQIAEREAKLTRPQLKELYDTSHFEPTRDFAAERSMVHTFGAVSDAPGTEPVLTQIMHVVENATSKLNNLVVLNQTFFYAAGGGQDCDHGELTIWREGCGEVYKVVNVFRVGHCVLHELDPPLPGPIESFAGCVVEGLIDSTRRMQLMRHHTAAHIVCAAARAVLGPHIWQHGAKKTVRQAHLDLTHFRGLTSEEEAKIEMQANNISLSDTPITRMILPKEEAEKRWGFSLYQGGIAPGNTLSIIDIHDIDIEACCGTHCSNTGVVGPIRILRSSRISDGIVRVEFVAGHRAVERTAIESRVLGELTTSWGVAVEEIPSTGQRFFTGFKQAQKLQAKVLELEMRLCVSLSDRQMLRGTASDCTPYISGVPRFAVKIREEKRNVAIIGDRYFYCLFASDDREDIAEKICGLMPPVKTKGSMKTSSDPLALTAFKCGAKVRNVIEPKSKQKKGGKKETVRDVREIWAVNIGATVTDVIQKFLSECGFSMFEAAQ